WTAGPVAMLVVGGLLALGSGGLLLAGGTCALAPVARDGAGFLSTPSAQLGDAGYALTSTTVTVSDGGPRWTQPGSILGTLRARVTTTDPSRAAFVGIARSADVEAYLSGVEHAQVTGFENARPTYSRIAGNRPPAAPDSQSFWITRTDGAGPLQLTWSADETDWVLVVMRADASPGVAVRADVGATLPALGRIAAGLLVAGGIGLAIAALLMIGAVSRAGAAGSSPGTSPMPR
ncbi:MAG: hypothetical protein WAL50_02960, partial [Kineosporiaceae bacterium]